MTSIVALIFVATANASQPKGARPTDAQTRSNLHRAEAAANRIVQRFHEELDFKSTFTKDFVIEPRLRARAVSLDNPDMQKRFDQATIERFYTGIMTMLHLWADYMLIQNVTETPPEIRELEQRLDLSTATQPATLSELNHTMDTVDSVSAIYRKYLHQSAFRGPIYQQNIRDERRRTKSSLHHVPRIEKGSKKFGIPETTPVYIVRQEVFDYYFVRERGVMKLFYVDILPHGLRW